MFADWSEGGEEALGMPGRLEATHGSFALAGRLMRVLCAIVEALVPAMFDAGHHLLLRCLVTAKLVRDEHTRHILAAFEEFTEELLRRSLVSPALDEDIEHVAILVNCPPEIGGLAVDLQKHFIQKPLVSRFGASAPKLIGIRCPNFR